MHALDLCRELCGPSSGAEAHFWGHASTVKLLEGQSSTGGSTRLEGIHFPPPVLAYTACPTSAAL